MPRATESGMRDELRRLPKAKLGFGEPMKCRLLREPHAAGDWVYEIKFDGIRAVAIKDKANVRIFSRLNNDLSARFSEVARAVQKLPCERAILDGEIVALDPEG